MVRFIDNIVFPEIIETRDSGQKEYAQNVDNVFANFERIGKLLNISREKVLLTYLLKHTEGIVSYVNGHESHREPIEGRIKDSMVYLSLLRAMLYENKEQDE